VVFLGDPGPRLHSPITFSCAAFSEEVAEVAMEPSSELIPVTQADRVSLSFMDTRCS
jgi:hypothetical protein